jgi:hypothetical protein
MSEEGSFDHVEAAMSEEGSFDHVEAAMSEEGSFDHVEDVVDPAEAPPDTAAGDESSPEPAAARPDGWRCDVCGAEGPLPEQAGFEFLLALHSAHAAALIEQLAAGSSSSPHCPCQPVLHVQQGGVSFFVCAGEEDAEDVEFGGGDVTAASSAADPAGGG